MPVASFGRLRRRSRKPRMPHRVCTSLADFDGDEMNIHVTQSPMAQAEVKYLMSVPNQIITPQSSKPVMGIVQDALLGAYLLTSGVKFFAYAKAIELVSWIKHPPRGNELPPPAVVHPKQLWTGHQLFSLLFPRDFVLDRWNKKLGLPEENSLWIHDGELLFGTLSKQFLGTSAGGIIDVLYRDFGPRCTVNFMTNEQRLINTYLLDVGFSIGISDCVLSRDGEKEVADKLKNAVRNIDVITHEVTDVNMKVMAEQTTVQILSKILMQTAGIVEKYMDDNNSIKRAVKAGSKGNPVNLSQICGCVGQQSVEGQRVRADKGGRTLPCFNLKDDTVNSKGLVQNSYALGLKADEFFFHAMGGREVRHTRHPRAHPMRKRRAYLRGCCVQGLVDTAVKTATTGYIQRRYAEPPKRRHRTCHAHPHVVAKMRSQTDEGDGGQHRPLRRYRSHGRRVHTGLFVRRRRDGRDEGRAPEARVPTHEDGRHRCTHARCTAYSNPNGTERSPEGRHRPDTCVQDGAFRPV